MSTKVPSKIVLPDLAIWRILSYAGVEELTTCRLVNRRWNDISCCFLKTKIKPIKFKSLRILNHFLSTISTASEGCPLQNFKLEFYKFNLDTLEEFLQAVKNRVRKFEVVHNHSSKVYRQRPDEDLHVEYGRRLALILRSLTQVQCLQVKIGFLLSADLELNFPKLKRLEIIISRTKENNEVEIIQKIVRASPSLKELVLNITFPSISFSEVVSEVLTLLPSGTVVDLSMYTSPQHFVRSLVSRYTKLLEVNSVCFSGLSLPFSLSGDPEVQQLLWKLFSKYATSLRTLFLNQKQNMEQVELDHGELTFPYCTTLSLHQVEGMTENSFKLFPNITKVELAMSEMVSDLDVLEVLVSKLPKLVELKLSYTTWKLLTKEPLLPIADILKIANSKKLNKEKQSLTSNPLGLMKGLKVLKVTWSDDTTIDWLLYISALGQINRLECLDVQMSKTYQEDMCSNQVKKLLHNYHNNFNFEIK